MQKGRIKTQILQIRVSPKERETIKAAAQASGMTVSDWIRVMAEGQVADSAA